MTRVAESEQTVPQAPIPLGRALDDAPMTRLHIRFWLLAALGILLDGFDFFIIGVANPLVKKDFHASASQVGLVSAAAIVGAVFGASLLGPLGDRLGRSRIFKYDLILFVIFSLLCIVAWNVWALIAFRFVLGLAIGLDYPLASSYLAEVLDMANGTGRRLSAILALKRQDLCLDQGPHGAIRWPADTDKTGKESLVPISSEVRAARAQTSRPGWPSMTSSACRPIDPVAPSRAIRGTR